jgi:hypothetical protein
MSTGTISEGSSGIIMLPHERDLTVTFTISTRERIEGLQDSLPEFKVGPSLIVGFPTRVMLFFGPACDEGLNDRRVLKAPRNRHVFVEASEKTRDVIEMPSCFLPMVGKSYSDVVLVVVVIHDKLELVILNGLLLSAGDNSLTSGVG